MKQVGFSWWGGGGGSGFTARWCTSRCQAPPPRVLPLKSHAPIPRAALVVSINPPVLRPWSRARTCPGAWSHIPQMPAMRRSYKGPWPSALALDPRAPATLGSSPESHQPQRTSRRAHADPAWRSGLSLFGSLGISLGGPSTDARGTSIDFGSGFSLVYYPASIDTTRTGARHPFLCCHRAP